MSSVRELFQTGKTLLRYVPAPAIEAKVLFMQATGLSEVELFASPQRSIHPKEERRYRRLIQRRLSGVPLAYITGRKEFWSLSLRIRRGVLIPRPETELLVEKTLDLAAGGEVTIVDIGTGSGNIALALARELPAARIVATDVSAVALRVAGQNAQIHGMDNITFVRGSLFAALRGLGLEGRCDFVVCNPPYVSAADWRSLSPEVKNHEPRRAFVGGRSGLEFIQRLIKGSAEYLKSRAYLLFEIGYAQAGPALSWLDKGWAEVTSFADLRGIPRVVQARRI